MRSCMHNVGSAEIRGVPQLSLHIFLGVEAALDGQLLSSGLLGEDFHAFQEHCLISRGSDLFIVVRGSTEPWNIHGLGK